MDAVLIADVSWILPMAWNILKVASGLGLVVFVHELGHFLVAKMCGVRCDKFYVGFDVPITIFGLKLPSSLFKYTYGETEYGIGIIPLGGYVKMFGQDDNPGSAEEEAAKIRRTVVGEDGVEREELDPRSLPAKSAPKRAAIFAAGVTMNLISAVFFAAFAYMMGVSYVPCYVASAQPGSAAWKADFQPGDKILSFATDDPKSEHQRFTRDLKYKVMLSSGKTLNVTVRRGEQELSIPVTPTPIPGEQGLYRIGMMAANTNVVGQVIATEKAEADSTEPSKSADENELVIKPGDKIVAIDGQEMTDGQQIAAYLAARPTGILKATIERQTEPKAEPQTLQVDVPPSPWKEFGFRNKLGPITAVQPNSPAASAGLKPGDLIQAINGAPVEHALFVEYQLLPLIEQSVALTIVRDGEEKTIEITPRKPRYRLFEPISADSAVGIEVLGVAYRVLPDILSVVPDSPAAKAGFKAGDTIKSVALASPDKKMQAKLKKAKYVDARELNDEVQWQALLYQFQNLPDDIEYTIAVQRDEQQEIQTLSLATSDTWTTTSRGMRFTSQEDIRTAESFGEAFTLGLEETGNGVIQVIETLKKLLTREVSATNLSGPIGIFTVAGHEASLGISRLLIFLTLLSANLAVLNLLPIPVLDGGHLLFLTWEMIFGKPVQERIQGVLSVGGLAFLLGLILFVSWFDIQRIFW